MEAIKLTYPSDDNLQIPVYIHRPTRSLDSHPIGVPHISENGETDVVLAIGIHGGFFVIGSALHVPPAQIKYLTRHGFVVVAPDYRLCPQVDVWNGPVQDCLNLYAWIVSGALQQSLMEHHISLDESRIVLFGQSVGGTLCQILVFFVTELTLMVEFHGGATAEGSIIILPLYEIQRSLDRSRSSIADNAGFPSNTYRNGICTSLIRSESRYQEIA
jgi:acetyl esterase/lipase